MENIYPIAALRTWEIYDNKSTLRTSVKPGDGCEIFHDDYQYPPDTGWN
jgi:hypothetical protein